MADTLSQQDRSKCMSANKNSNTKPEMLVRRLVFSLGYRYRLHNRKLPGCPDLVFAGHKKVIFVNGCYWHRHNCKKGKSTPQTRQEFWETKFKRTAERDKENIKLLEKKGWKVLVIWECQIKKDIKKVQEKIVKFLG
ncbi:Very short patch repair protein [Limihaloglobus sulfuriphilus]|uniref:Very short patch repair endonuclease n=1 Tax=Limihaloglobus sulfuriphilus TaxID=1851148 RepID=A0A1R7T607_9BACT|nr:very short patch repair endonuclease [Limihaloglobus sulfuriphilus]AQQ72103.1 Very short patch repair protein [Limihaloglobus sulfuriphilus]